MGNKEGKLAMFEEVPEEEWEKEEHESSQETMTMLNRKFEEMPSKVKSAMEKAGVSEQEIKDNLHIAYTVSYFNFRKEYGDFQIAEKKGKCPQCPKENLLKASNFGPNTTTRQVVDGILRQRMQLDPTKKKERVAVKKLPHKDKFDRIANYCEIFYSMELKHPNIVQYKCAWLIPAGTYTKDSSVPEIWMAMEFLQGGTLNEASKVIRLQEKHVAYVAREVCQALKYIHEKGYAHRDLKSQNVMLSIDGAVKLIDMGLMCDFRNGPRTRTLGSPYWIPPEMILCQPHSFQVDVWSMAVCLLELMIQKPPLYGNTTTSMFHVATKGLVDQIPEAASPQAKEFLNACLVMDPAKRAMPPELLKYKWVCQENLEDGIVDVLRNVFLNNAIQNLSSF